LDRISKKWKWTGELFVDVEPAKAERLCDVVLTDATDHPPEGLRLNILFSTLSFIRFRKLCGVFHLDLILDACKPSEQVARLGPQDEKDAGVLKALVSRMSAHKQVGTV
jgi:hypothetical protein